MSSFRDKITPAWVQKYVAVYKERGFKALLKEAGWKVVVGVIVFYLVRDVVLYIVIPYFIYKEVSQ